MASCNDEQVFNQADTAPLQVSVNTQGTQSSRAIIHGEYLPDGSSIGISLFTPDGNDYDNQGYFNVKYTASGEGESQSWTAQGTTPSISANPANLLAYYPWSDNQDLDLTAIPVENTSQTDYMYAHPVTGVTNANPKVNIIMKHALTAIRVNLVLGDYTGDAGVSGITVKSPALGSAATMDITNNGALNGISGQGDEFALTTEFELSAAGTATDVLFVPDASVTEVATTVSATIGGKKYTASISFDESYLQGYIYTYTLTLNNSGFEVTKVNVTPWEPGNDDSAILEPEKENNYIVQIAVPDDNYEFTHNIGGFVGTIDWGDGTVSEYINTTVAVQHTYQSAGDYIVAAKGTIVELNSYSLYDSDNRIYYDASLIITKIISIGIDTNVEWMSYAFKDQELLTDIIPGALDGCTNVKDFSYAFNGCTNLQSIPEGLFDKCTEVTSFYWTFQRCKGLTSIPKGLFDKCTEVTEFSSTFGNCTKITVIPVGLFDHCTKVTDFDGTFSSTGITSIPGGLFDKCTKVTSFRYAFDGCESLTEIPEGLFKNNAKVKDIRNVFADCTSLQSIPEGLFDACTEVTSLFGIFWGCKNLKTVPKGLFDKCTKVTDFSYTFRDCKSLTTIPEGLFDKCTEVTTFNYTFYSCDNLNILPVNLFDNNRKVTDFGGMCWGCESLTGESPYTVLNVNGEDVKVHLYERELYPEYFTAPTSYRFCFTYCFELTDWSSMQSAWNSASM